MIVQFYVPVELHFIWVIVRNDIISLISCLFSYCVFRVAQFRLGIKHRWGRWVSDEGTWWCVKKGVMVSSSIHVGVCRVSSFPAKLPQSAELLEIGHRFLHNPLHSRQEVGILQQIPWGASSRELTIIISATSNYKAHLCELKHMIMCSCEIALNLCACVSCCKQVACCVLISRGGGGRRKEGGG